MYHYVYRITNKVLGKHYYGVRSSRCAPMDDLGTTYLSSSSDKQFKTDQKANPANYKYKVVSMHLTRELALAKEVKLHKYFNVAVNQSFYNKAVQTSTKFSTFGTKVSAETKKKLSKLFTGKGNPFYGKEHSEASKAKISNNHCVCNGSANSMFGATHTLATKAKISKANSGKGNGRALTINIYNNGNLLMYSCTGSFKKTCEEHGLPFRALRKTLEKDTKMDNPFKTNKAFKGWYARRSDA